MFLFWFTRDQFALISYNSVVRALVSLLRTVSSQFFFQKMPQTFDKFSSVKSNAKVPKNKKKIRPLYYCKFTISSTSFCENVISETSWFENSSFLWNSNSFSLKWHWNKQQKSMRLSILINLICNMSHKWFSEGLEK